MSKSVKPKIPKGASSVLELKVTRPNPDIALACANSMFEFIAQFYTLALNSQSGKNIEIVDAELAKINKHLEQNKILLSRSDSSRGPFTPTLYALVNQTSALESDRNVLVDKLASWEAIATSFNLPIYIDSKLIYPKSFQNLSFGFFTGLFLGMVISLALKATAKRRIKKMGGILNVG